MGDPEADQPPFLLRPAPPPEPEREQEMPPTRRSRLAGYALVLGILVAFAGLNLAMLAEFVAVEAFVTGERVEIACDGDGRCSLARSGPWGSFRPVGQFPEGGIVDVVACPPADRACWPGLWLDGWEGPVPAAAPGPGPGGGAPQPGVLFVPLTERVHEGGSGGPTLAEIDRHRSGDGPWRLRVDTHRWLPFPLVPVVLGVEAVGLGLLLTVIARRLRREHWPA